MSERIFNLYLDIKDQVIFELRVAFHDKGGSDKWKLSFLQKSTKSDLPRAKSFPVPERYRVVDGETLHHSSSLTYESYLVLSQLGKHLELFEEAFEQLGAPTDPLVCITPIVDGELQVDVVEYF